MGWGSGGGWGPKKRQQGQGQQQQSRGFGKGSDGDMSDDEWKRAHGYTEGSPGWNMSRAELEGFEGGWERWRGRQVGG